MRFFSVVFICIIYSSAIVVAETPISVLAWNVESGGSDPKVIAKQLAELGSHDVYCLSEV